MVINELRMYSNKVWHIVYKRRFDLEFLQMPMNLVELVFYSQAVNNCNNLHTALGYGFINLMSALVHTTSGASDCLEYTYSI